MARLRNKLTGVIVNVNKDSLDGFEPVNETRKNQEEHATPNQGSARKSSK